MWSMPRAKVRSGMRTLDLKPMPVPMLWGIVQLVTCYREIESNLNDNLVSCGSCSPLLSPEQKEYPHTKNNLIPNHLNPLPPRHIHIRRIIKPRLQKLSPIKTTTGPPPIDLQILKQITHQHLIIYTHSLNLPCYPSQLSGKELLEGDIEVDENRDRVKGGLGKLVGCAGVGEEVGCGCGYEGEVGDEVVEGGVGGK